MEYGLVVVWWATLLALAAAGLPIAATLLCALPDRGASLALPAALTVLFVPVYWLGHLHFGPWTVAVGVLVLVATSFALGRRRPPIDRRRFLESAVVFTLGFALVVAIRAVDPSILTAGGEKFLDYGLLKTTRTAGQLPPTDMWFAGEPVAYYYGGQLLAATVATVTGTATRYTYNLALAGVFGALVAGVYGLCGSIATARGRSYRWAGGLGVFLVGFAANVVTPVQVILWSLPESLADGLAHAIAERTALPAEELVHPGAFSYWSASRVIPGTINEFPLFAFLNGDLHAHMISTPLMLLVVGLCFAYARTAAGSIRRRRFLVYGAIPPVGGTVAVVNTWSLPTVAGLAGLTILFAESPARDLLPAARVDRFSPTGPVGREALRMGSSLFAAVGVVVLSILWVAPFVGVLLAGPDTRSIAFFPDRSGLVALLLVHGWFLAIFAGYLGTRSNALGRHLRTAVALVAVAAVVGLLLDAAAVAIVLPLLGVAWFLLRRRAHVGFEAVLLVAGAGLVLLVEFVYLAEPAGPGRFNTVFKTYAQVWLLWAVGAAVALADVVPQPTALDTWYRRGGSIIAALLLVSASIYGVVALGAHFQDAPEATLDATTWAQTTHSAEWEAIAFLDRRPGQPTLVSAPGCYCHGLETVEPYSWVNAPSTFSRAAAVAGWSHTADYHGEADYQRRVADIRTIYTGTDAARTRLLERYDVAYVYLGPNERALYGNVSIGDTPGLTVAFENDAVTIYAVDEPA